MIIEIDKEIDRKIFCTQILQKVTDLSASIQSMDLSQSFIKDTERMRTSTDITNTKSNIC